jgi:hypothetical protein
VSTAHTPVYCSHTISHGLYINKTKAEIGLFIA